MITCEKIMNLEDVVRMFLTEYPELRADDDALGARVDIHYNPALRGSDYYEVRAHRWMYLEYTTESIRRVRQKVQAEYPELRPTRDQIQKRKMQEAEYRRYARGLSNRKVREDE